MKTSGPKSKGGKVHSWADTWGQRASWPSVNKIINKQKFKIEHSSFLSKETNRKSIALTLNHVLSFPFHLCDPLQINSTLIHLHFFSNCHGCFCNCVTDFFWGGGGCATDWLFDTIYLTDINYGEYYLDIYHNVKMLRFVENQNGLLENAWRAFDQFEILANVQKLQDFGC